jgi:hypothetical protein
MTIAWSKSDHDCASTAVMGRKWPWAADYILIGIGDIENRDEMTSGTTENPTMHRPATARSTRIVPGRGK